MLFIFLTYLIEQTVAGLVQWNFQCQNLITLARYVEVDHLPSTRFVRSFILTHFPYFQRLSMALIRRRCHVSNWKSLHRIFEMKWNVNVRSVIFSNSNVTNYEHSGKLPKTNWVCISKVKTKWQTDGHQIENATTAAASQVYSYCVYITSVSIRIQIESRMA